MERIEFQQKTIEDKLLALFDEIQSVKAAMKPRPGFSISKQYWKISEVAAMLGKAYCTIENYCSSIGIDYKRVNGLKCLTNADVEQLARYCKREDVILS